LGNDWHHEKHNLNAFLISQQTWSNPPIDEQTVEHVFSDRSVDVTEEVRRRPVDCSGRFDLG
jgi:hypothetical protein